MTYIEAHNIYKVCTRFVFGCVFGTRSSSPPSHITQPVMRYKELLVPSCRGVAVCTNGELDSLTNGQRNYICVCVLT